MVVTTPWVGSMFMYAIDEVINRLGLCAGFLELFFHFGDFVEALLTAWKWAKNCATSAMVEVENSQKNSRSRGGHCNLVV